MGICTPRPGLAWAYPSRFGMDVSTNPLRAAKRIPRPGLGSLGRLGPTQIQMEKTGDPCMRA